MIWSCYNRRMTNPIRFLLLLVFSFCVCRSASAEELAVNKVTSTTWILVAHEMKSEDGKKETVKVEAEATLGFKDGKVVGNAGCNQFSTTGSVLATGVFECGRIMTTRKMCPAPQMTAERTMTRFLPQMKKAQLNDTKLMLSSEDGSLRMLFKAK